MLTLLFSFFFFFNDTATTEIYTLSLHDALPILFLMWPDRQEAVAAIIADMTARAAAYGRTLKFGYRISAFAQDRKSTRLNSSHLVISYAVFCLKKKKKTKSESTNSEKNTTSE